MIFCAAVQRINFFPLSIMLYCLPLMLVNKVDQKIAAGRSDQVSSNIFMYVVQNDNVGQSN